MRKLWHVLSGLYLFYIAFLFLGWYIKMHFHPKWFWAFWIYSIIVIVAYCNHSYIHDLQYGKDNTRSGYEIWNENMRNYK
jgi:hypothetical protein